MNFSIISISLICFIINYFSFDIFAQRSNPTLTKEDFHPITIHNRRLDSLVKHYREKTEKYLIKTKYLHSLYAIDSTGVKIYATSYHKKKNKPEFSLSWDEVEVFDKLIKYAEKEFAYDIFTNKRNEPLSPMVNSMVKILEENHVKPLPHNPNKPLDGLRIAIDPGHTAGNFQVAKIEQRHTRIFYEHKWYEFAEGILTLATANILKDSLLKYGAEVFVTRTKPNSNVNGLSYQQWLKYRLPQILRKEGLNETQIQQKIKTTPSEFFFEYYSNEDLDNRATKINAFKPHFTIVMHYNVDGGNKGWQAHTEKNYSMTFVPGAYMQGELNSPKDRYDFVRTLLTNHFEESVILSGYVQEAFEKHLNVPAVTEEDNPYYIKNSCMKVTNGIYARNLRLCRLLNTPVCYGEPLLQDNCFELVALAQHNEKTKTISPRIIEVANAYFKGVMNYADHLKRKKG
jgi:N-acetylmuramoyl-L-alanine amidase